MNDLFGLDGQVAIVTGGSRGLGKVMGAALGEAGADIVICSRNKDQIEAELQAALAESWASRVGALFAAPALQRLLVRRDPSAHNGAPLLGLNKVVVKSHGGANCKGMTRAILEAGREARRQVPVSIGASIHKYHLETT